MKFMLLQHYGRVEGDVPPMTEWKPEDVQAHIKFQKDLNAELRERGELVDAQALAGPDLAKIVLATDGAPAVTDGPFAGVQGAARRLPDGRRRVARSGRSRSPRSPPKGPAPTACRCASRSRSAR